MKNSLSLALALPLPSCRSQAVQRRDLRKRMGKSDSAKFNLQGPLWVRYTIEA
jgi:hypothetical protein